MQVGDAVVGPYKLESTINIGVVTGDYYYAAEAPGHTQNIERQRSGLRLLNGEDVVSMVLANYGKLPQELRSIIPLTNVLVVADSAE